MNKNLKRLFVTTAIITSLANTNDAHAMSLMEQRYNEGGLEGAMDYVEDRVQWINGLEDMTGSLMLDVRYFAKAVTAEKNAGKNDNTIIRAINIIDEYVPLKEEARKQIQEKEEHKALKLKKKQDIEAQKLEEEKRVKADLAWKQQEEAEAKLKKEEAEENERKKWEAEKKELKSLRDLVLRSQTLNDLQKLQFTQLERKEKEKKKEQAEKREKQKQQREAEQAENEKNDNLRRDIAKNVSNRKDGIWGDKIEEELELDHHDADVGKNPQRPSYESYEKDTYNNIPFTQLSSTKQEKIIAEYKKSELERFYENKQTATNNKKPWDKASPFIKKTIKDEYESDKQQKIIEYYYYEYYKNNVSFDKLSSARKERIKNDFNNCPDKAMIIESYERKYDRNIRKIHEEDPQFKYNVTFFEFNDELKIRKKEEYIQKKEKKERKEKKQEAEEKAKKKYIRASDTYERTLTINNKTRYTATTTDKFRNTTKNKKIKELESKIIENKINNGTKAERKRLKKELEKLKEELEVLRKEQDEGRIRVLKEKLKEKEEAEDEAAEAERVRLANEEADRVRLEAVERQRLADEAVERQRLEAERLEAVEAERVRAEAERVRLANEAAEAAIAEALETATMQTAAKKR